MRAILAVMSHWSSKWAHSECIHLLATEFDTVAKINTPNTDDHVSVARLQEKYMYTMNVQYAGNFICHDVRE